MKRLIWGVIILSGVDLNHERCDQKCDQNINLIYISFKTLRGSFAETYGKLQHCQLLWMLNRERLWVMCFIPFNSSYFPHNANSAQTQCVMIRLTFCISESHVWWLSNSHAFSCILIEPTVFTYRCDCILVSISFHVLLPRTLTVTCHGTSCIMWRWRSSSQFKFVFLWRRGGTLPWRIGQWCSV